MTPSWYRYCRRRSNDPLVTWRVPLALSAARAELVVNCDVAGASSLLRPVGPATGV